MGKGGYNGGSTIIRTAPSWVAEPGASKVAERKKKKLPFVPFELLTEEHARAAGLTKSQWLKRCRLRLRTIDEDIAIAKRKLAQLEDERAAALAAINAAKQD